MKSNVHTIKKGGLGLEHILTEVEKVTTYNELQKKEALRLRLLTEELVGILPELFKNFEGSFWIQNQENAYEIHVELSVEGLSKEKKEALIDISSAKKNVASSGFMGKIREIAENMLMHSDDASELQRYGFIEQSNVYTVDAHYSYAWTLKYYLDQQAKTGNRDSEEWDKLEKSIVGKLADDVIVGVRGKKVEIIIKKAF